MQGRVVLPYVGWMMSREVDFRLGIHKHLGDWVRGVYILGLTNDPAGIPR